MERKIKVLFICRIILWAIALAATLYWIYWSFQLYELKIFDVLEYSSIFRPIFGKCLLISVVSIGISLILRMISDKFKRELDQKKYEA